MAKYVILNFDETDRFRLTTERPELSLASSTFNPAKPGVFFLPDDSEAVFIQLIGLNPVKDLGHDAGPALSRFVDAGGRVVCFIGPSDQGELGKLIGPFPELHFQPNSLPESIFFNPEEPYQSVFEQFQMSISHAYKLLPATLTGEAWDVSPKLSRSATVLAKSSDGCPVALLLPHARGSYVLLPWFGTNNIDVVSTLLSPPRKKTAPEPEVSPPAKPEAEKKEVRPIPNQEPGPTEAPVLSPAPSLAELESVIAGISESGPKPAPVETPAPDRTAPPADAAPVVPKTPVPAPEPVVLPVQKSESRPREIPPLAGETAVPDIGVVIADLSIPVPHPEIPPPANHEPATVETPVMAPAPSPAVQAPIVPVKPAPTPVPEIVPVKEFEPIPEDIPPIAAMPSLAVVGSLIADLSKPASKPEIPPPTNHEPAAVETPLEAPAPSPDVQAPVVPEKPAPTPEPEVLPAEKPVRVAEEVPPPAAMPPRVEAVPPAAEFPPPVSAPSPPAEDHEPRPAETPVMTEAPDKVSVPSIPDLVAGSEEAAWLEQEEYAFPELKEIYAKRDAETQRYALAKQEIDERHAHAMRDIDERLQAFKASGQESFLNLLRSEGPELVQAVIYVLKYLGWSRVIDVHDYWKKVIRAKEEEVWVLESDSPSVEAGLMRDKLLLVVVRSGPAAATDEECALLQRYKGRRMQEYSNTQMRALLIGNYFLTTEGKARTNPFSPQQAEEAEKDGNALLSTYDLFRAVKAEKEGRVGKEDLRREIREKKGLIAFSS